MNDNTALNDNRHLPTVQVLTVACITHGNEAKRLTWLHGYCLLTCRPVGATVQVTGEVCVGERYRENWEMIQGLADALDPDAVLSGFDLTDTIGRLGGLPIDTKDRAPSLNLLGKLRTMLERQSPIDLALTEDSRTEVFLQAMRNAPALDEGVDANGVELEFDLSRDSGNWNQMAVDLADAAGKCLLAFGNLYLGEDRLPALMTDWQQWREDFEARLPVSKIGGEPIRLS